MALRAGAEGGKRPRLGAQAWGRTLVSCFVVQQPCTLGTGIICPSGRQRRPAIPQPRWAPRVRIALLGSGRVTRRVSRYHPAGSVRGSCPPISVITEVPQRDSSNRGG